MKNFDINYFNDLLLKSEPICAAIKYINLTFDAFNIAAIIDINPNIMILVLQVVVLKIYCKSYLFYKYSYLQKLLRIVQHLQMV